MSGVEFERDDVSLLGLVEECAIRAQRQFESISPKRRVAFLRECASGLEEDSELLVSTATRETFLKRSRITGELARTVRQFRLMADEVDRGTFFEATIDLHHPNALRPHPDLRRSLAPIGTVAVYAASNFPLAFGAAGTDTSAAFAAGCSVVTKAHPLQPETADLSVATLREAAVRSGIEANVIQGIHGFEAGRLLVQERFIKAAAFTGSTSGGRDLFDLASRRSDPIPFYGELGSINPVLVTESVLCQNADAVVSEVARAITGSMGQLCTRPSLVLVPQGKQGDRFEQLLAAAVCAADVDPMLSVAIAERFVTARDRIAASPFVRTLTLAEPDSNGVAATVVSMPAEQFLSNSDPYVQEIFGPYALVIRYADHEMLAEVVEVLPGSLTFTFRGVPDDPEISFELVTAARRRAGRILGGGVPTGVSVTGAQMHGGTWPAATSPSHSSVGSLAALRFLRPVAYQEMPNALLPPELQDANPLGIERVVDGIRTRDAISRHSA